jgi:hypothetical protein
MAAPFSANTPQYIINNAQAKLAALRNALAECEEYYQWLIGYAQADLTGIGMATLDVSSIFTAFADANAFYQVWNTGQAPGSYPQVTTTPYVYAASMRIVIGPLS